MEQNTEKMFAEIMESLKGLDARVARIEAATLTEAHTGGDVLPRAAATRKVSIKEFLIERAPSDDVQKTLAVGYFLETSEGMSSFNKNDLEKGFRSAKESLPSNINDKVNMCIKNGHMMEAEEKKDNMKAWVLTRTGEEYLKNGFKKDGRKK